MKVLLCWQIKFRSGYKPFEMYGDVFCERTTQPNEQSMTLLMENYC